MALWSRTDAYAIDDDDDDTSCDADSSSEDEINIILNGTPEQKRKLKRVQDRYNAKKIGEHQDEASSSEDEFEREMNAELNQHIKFMQQRDFTRKENSNAAQPSYSENQPQEEGFYDEIYFDSDEEADEEHTSGSGKHAIISNDDLLYDPTLDDKDQKWVDRQRRKNNNTTFHGVLSGDKNKPAKLPTSDALLDCPACMTTLCIDCQRHETYKHQYRAMFVMNCVVDTTQKLECPQQQTKKKKKKRPPPSSDSSSDLFNPVKCTECNTVVGVIDTDEVYHFFNVLASHT